MAERKMRFCLVVTMTLVSFLWGCSAESEPVAQSPANLISEGRIYPPQVIIEGIQWLDFSWASIPLFFSNSKGYSGHLCGFRDDQDGVWCFGRTRTAFAERTERHAREVVKVLDGSWIRIATSWRLSCAIDDSNALFCWGDRSQLDEQETDDWDQESRAFPPMLWHDGHVEEVYLSMFSAKCFLDSNRLLSCEDFGSLDHDPAMDSALQWESIELGGLHACGLDVDSRVWCWGSDDPSALGVTSVTSQPVRVELGADAISLSAGSRQTCAVTAAYELYCWGEQYRQDGEYEVVAVPTQFFEQIDFLDVSVGLLHACALTLDKDIVCWGSNEAGALGHPDIAFSEYPVSLGIEQEWLALQSRAEGTCALADDGKLWCWGDLTSLD